MKSFDTFSQKIFTVFLITLFTIFSASASVTSTTLPGTFVSGWYAYESENYSEALLIWTSLAEQGDARAQTNLGTLFDYGLGVPTSPIIAAKWYEAAALQGNATAQFNLGLMYETGRGLQRDYSTAVKWYQQAANQDQAFAQYNLALMYINGEGVAQDKESALNLLYKAGKNHLANQDVVNITNVVNAIELADIENQYAQQLRKESASLTITDTDEFQTKEEQPLSLGTGWPTNYGYVVTNNHVVSTSDDVILVNVQGEHISATVMLRDIENDIAFIKAENPSELPPALPLSEKHQGLGSSVFTIGFPRIDVMGKTPKLSDGIISSVNGINDDPFSYQISVPIQPGNSGGPLINMRGEVVGMVTSMLGLKNPETGYEYTLQNVNYAVKSDLIKQLLKHTDSQEMIGELPRNEGNLEALANRVKDSVLIVMSK